MMRFTSQTAVHRRHVFVVLFTLLASMMGLAACGPVVPVPAFRQQLESVHRASPFGPFEGKVLDADNQKPIEGALVSCTWVFDRGIGSPTPYDQRSVVTHTAADGRYQVPSPSSLPQGLSTRLARFSFVVYRKGYVSYRHDAVFEPRRHRVGFVQLSNLITLTRWSPELSHARHLVFFAENAALRRAADGEVSAAAAELSGQTTPVATKQPAPSSSGKTLARATQVALLLDEDDIRRVTGYTGRFIERPLERPGDALETLHFRAVDQPERYDVALRLWRRDEQGLRDKLQQLRKSLPDSKPTTDVGDGALITTPGDKGESNQGEILGLAFIDTASSALVLLTCGRGQCDTDAKLITLAKIIAVHLDRLPPLAAPQGNGDEPPNESTLMPFDEEPTTAPKPAARSVPEDE